MRKVTYFMAVFVITISLVSCQKQVTLQQYFVEKSNQPDFTTMNFNPNDYLKGLAFDDEKSKALKTIKSVNVLSFKKQDEVQFQKETEQIKEILSNEKYQELLKLNDKGSQTVVTYLGDDSNINEVILYSKGSSQQYLVRVLTDGLTVTQLGELVGSFSSLLPMVENIGLFQD
ncbi:MAG: DUF4252 domain-containing protein [Capnocytophaga sp.]|nr:DUF4252 domain-containing protein [Capnocytophaga sp.]